MSMAFTGEAAAIAASVLWTFTSLAFTIGSRRIGSFSVNMWRLLFALAFLALSQLIIFRTLVPAANGAQWGYLGLSGIIGLGIGDLGYFGCLVILGPRRGTLLMAINPIFASVAGFFVLGEVLNAWSALGISVALAGVLLVILESEDRSTETALSRERKTQTRRARRTTKPCEPCGGV